MLLHETAPQWVTDVVINRTMPKFIKIPFYLLPHPSSGIKPLRKDKLSASDMLQVRKVIEHVYEKMMGSPSETGSQNAPSSAGHERSSSDERNNSRNNGSDKDEERSSIAEEKVELMCQDQLLDSNMDLRTVKHFIWKSGGDLVLHYRPIK
jgi:WD repeat-containing protein 48